jgi:hypothetical protein
LNYKEKEDEQEPKEKVYGNLSFIYILDEKATLEFKSAINFKNEKRTRDSHYQQ